MVGTVMDVVWIEVDEAGTGADAVGDTDGV
jgi:hypothetical protein